jgi:4-methyl-5(b-hydroxyethyl)-thiazole monophosphate biosynthesis
MTKKICVPLAEGFEEIEAVTLVDILRRAGFDVMTCALGDKIVAGAHTISITADIALDEALERGWDMVLLPGGMPGSANLRDDARVGKLLHATREAGNWIGAICAAPIALAKHGLLSGHTATSYPGFGDQLGQDVTYSEDRVVCDDRVMTSRGPGTAMTFALAVVEQLAGSDAAEKLRGQLLAS